MQGAPNVGQFLPAANAIIDYRKLGSPAELRLELQRLNSDGHAWAAKVRPSLPLHGLLMNLAGLCPVGVVRSWSGLFGAGPSR